MSSEKGLSNPAYERNNEDSSETVNQEMEDRLAASQEERGYWGHKAEFILSCVGLSVGIGNVWRFPYIAYANGGGAFLLPYLFMLFVIGKPIYYMELAIGQYCRLGPSQLFHRMCPISMGVGLSMLYVCFIVTIYYNVIMSYSVYYFFAVLIGWFRGGALPWDVCDEAWASPTCWVRNSGANSTQPELGPNETRQVSAEQYFYRAVAQNQIGNVTYNITNIGGVVWELFGCLVFCWVVVYLCLMKGIKSSGKVVYLTATLPYVLLLILFFRGVTLPGAGTGVLYFIQPTWEKLALVATWRAAATQLFFSLSTSWGCLIMFGSYNRFKNNCYYDAIFVSSLDTFTSIIAGIVIFSVLGNLALNLNVNVEDVAKPGIALAFVIYPEAISNMPLGHFWGVCFFIMLFVLGLDSEFALLETVLTAVYDHFPALRTKRYTVTAIACILCLIVALPCVTNGGLDVVDLMDVYGGSFSVLFIAFYELVTISWIYGIDRFGADLVFMIDRMPSWYWKSTWKFIGPIIIIIIIIATFTSPETFSATAVWPAGIQFIGWILALCGFLPPLVLGIWVFWKSPGDGFREKWANAITPLPEWGPGDPAARRALNASRSNAVLTWSKSYQSNSQTNQGYTN